MDAGGLENVVDLLERETLELGEEAPGEVETDNINSNEDEVDLVYNVSAANVVVWESMCTNLPFNFGQRLTHAVSHDETKYVLEEAVHPHTLRTLAVVQDLVGIDVMQRIGWMAVMISNGLRKDGSSVEMLTQESIGNLKEVDPDDSQNSHGVCGNTVGK